MLQRCPRCNFDICNRNCQVPTKKDNTTQMTSKQQDDLSFPKEHLWSTVYLPFCSRNEDQETYTLEHVSISMIIDLYARDTSVCLCSQMILLGQMMDKMLLTLMLLRKLLVPNVIQSFNLTVILAKQIKFSSCKTWYP